MRPKIWAAVLGSLLAGCGGGDSGPASKSGWTVEGNRARYTDAPEKERLKTSKGKPSTDLRTIEVSSDAGELRVTASFDEVWDAYFDTEEMGDVVLELWIDADSNASTGGVLLGGAAKGFEFVLKPVVSSEIDFGSTPARLTGYSAGYGIQSLRQDEDEFAAGRRTTVEDLKASKVQMEDSKSRCTVQGSDLRFSVPYSLLNVRSGQTVRLAVMERYGSIFSKESLFPELTLKLQ